jgi:hypothetical protein
MPFPSAVILNSTAVSFQDGHTELAMLVLKDALSSLNQTAVSPERGYQRDASDASQQTEIRHGEARFQISPT